MRVGIPPPTITCANCSVLLCVLPYLGVVKDELSSCLYVQIPNNFGEINWKYFGTEQTQKKVTSK